MVTTKYTQNVFSYFRELTKYLNYEEKDDSTNLPKNQ